MNVLFYTLGCKVNQYETQAMREEFLRRGFTAEKDLQADIIIINTCSVTAESDRKARQLLNRVKRENPNAVTVLTGCMVQAFPESSKQLSADIIIGNRDVSNVINAVQKYLPEHKKAFICDEHKKGDSYNTLPITRFDERTRAFMKIEDGCDRFCSYCIIPYARGRVRSRSLAEISAEAQTLSENGFREIVLVGINLSAYGKGENFDLCDAVDAVCKIDGIQRVRLGSLEPDHITDEMLARFKAQEKFCPQFHLSLQSGCDETLKRMNRHYDTAFYYDLVCRIRNCFKNAAVTTDIMVGFAGETEEEFNESLAFVKKVGFARSHVFAYSVREGTAAAKFGNQLSAAEKSRRSRIMASAAAESEKRHLESLVGATLPVLFEKHNEGYTPDYSRVLLKGSSAEEGEIKNILITAAFDTHCEGAAAQ